MSDFSDKLEVILRSNPEKALRMRPASDPKNASRGDSWVAAQLLSNAPWLSEHLHSDLISWALEAWLSQPPIESMSALEGVAWLFATEKSQGDFKPIAEGIDISKANSKELFWSFFVISLSLDLIDFDRLGSKTTPKAIPNIANGN